MTSDIIADRTAIETPINNTNPIIANGNKAKPTITRNKFIIIDLPHLVITKFTQSYSLAILLLWNLSL